jgi:glycine reductase complex component B subunit alpha and beta
VTARGLTLQEHTVSDLRWSDRSACSGGVLTLDRAEVLAAAAAEPPVERLELSVVRPGQAIRINRVLDVLEPRTKSDSEGATFPGIASGNELCGDGETVAAHGMALVATGTLPNVGGGFEQQDCVIDMIGPAASHTPFSRTVNLVLRYTLSPGTDQADSERAIRESNVRLARWIGGLFLDQGPSRSWRLEAGDGRPNSRELPRLAYVCQLISEGRVHDTLLRGATTEHLEPTWLTPGELADGAVVSADFHYACQRVPTYLYQRNPVVHALLARAGELELGGVILTIRRNSDTEKRSAAVQIAELAKARGITGLITHPAVGGNAQLDALYLVQEAERRGIRTAMIVQEMAGADGADPGLVDFVPEADLLVSTGNREELLDTADLDDVVGDRTMLDGRPASGALRLPLRTLCGSTTQVGALSLRGTPA